MALEKTYRRVVVREQITNLVEGANATVERWMNVTTFYNGEEGGTQEMVKLKDRPVSSFATLADYDTITEDDIVQPVGPT